MPGSCGTTKSCATWPSGGWTSKKIGTSSRLPNTQHQRESLEAAEIRRCSPRAMMSHGGDDDAHDLAAGRDSRAPRLMPMNSVTMVSALSRNRSMTLNAPQNLPKRSRISRAWPTPVTAPRRSTISWFT